MPGWHLPYLRLPELEDQPWCPSSLRDALTDYLAAIITLTSPYAVCAAKVEGVAQQSSSGRIVDLCSGGGGPWRSLLPELRRRGVSSEVVATDLYPNSSTAPGMVRWNKPVDARRVPAELAGARTLFTSFHHFNDSDAEEILRSAAEAGEPIGVFEVTSRRPGTFVLMLLTPLFVILLSPFTWKRSLWRLFFTFIIPVIPLAITYDGLVSCLRSRTADELTALAAGADSMRFETGELTQHWPPVRVTYLIGLPTALAGNQER